MPPEESKRAGILPGCASLDRRSREAEVGFEPRTLRSVDSRSNHLGHLAPIRPSLFVTTLVDRLFFALHELLSICLSDLDLFRQIHNNFRSNDNRSFSPNKADRCSSLNPSIFTAVAWIYVATNPPLRTTTLPSNALTMSSRLAMKRLQSNCPAQRTNQRPSTLPELPKFSSIEDLLASSACLQRTSQFLPLQRIARDISVSVASFASSEQLFDHIRFSVERSAVTPLRCQAATSPKGSTRAETLPGCPSLDIISRGAWVEYESRAFWSAGIHADPTIPHVFRRCYGREAWPARGWPKIRDACRSGIKRRSDWSTIWTQQPIMTQYWPNAGCQWSSRTRQKFQKVIAAYAIYTKRCTTVPDFVLGIRPTDAPILPTGPSDMSLEMLLDTLISAPSQEVNQLLRQRPSPSTNYNRDAGQTGSASQ
ncbi:LOW QUALITY PROTEIN: hypothetical protein T265_13607 [Opisthorchis viverrini]|uniref:Uncharacterized protein n=1 Tax=Opisthorchis viverrini TaxID=6198 RepID=A0A074ZMM1_OPIVI|nr:LOW QUALITY PROTEIN: hypothetical protein T265_13607 [Opisthorchis viverrini]KER28361.1 LOW QUALITY PROTEIN: hypothetical protein T265_13607 [Opisthorchis viverrini]